MNRSGSQRASRAIRLFALVCSPDATLRLTMLSKRDGRGLAANLPYEFDLGRRSELAVSTSLWNRPRLGGSSSSAERLRLLVLEPEPGSRPILHSLDDVRSSKSCMEPEEEGAFKGPGEARYSPDTPRGKERPRMSRCLLCSRFGHSLGYSVSARESGPSAQQSRCVCYSGAARYGWAL